MNIILLLSLLNLSGHRVYPLNREVITLPVSTPEHETPHRRYPLYTTPAKLNPVKHSPESSSESNDGEYRASKQKGLGTPAYYVLFLYLYLDRAMYNHMTWISVIYAAINQSLYGPYKTE